MPALPKPNARRRNASSEFSTIEGDNTAPPPAWPGAEAPTEAEAARWALLWSSPVSRKWEATEAPLVLRVVRLQLEVEAGTYRRAGELRQLEDRLALNPLARQRHRLKVNDRPHASDDLGGDVVPLTAVRPTGT